MISHSMRGSLEMYLAGPTQGSNPLRSPDAVVSWPLRPVAIPIVKLDAGARLGLKRTPRGSLA